jgi:integrase
VKPRKAVPYAQVPALVRQILGLDSISASALLFTILTGARTSETRGARWDEIDFERRVWTVPGERMKAKKEHRVALSDAALDLLRGLPRKGPLVFPGKTLSRLLSIAAMRECLKGLRPDGSTVHGFRSSFATWAAEQTSHPSEVVEASLSHATGDAVELAYKRTDYLAKRMALMNDWGAFCLGGSIRAVQ